MASAAGWYRILACGALLLAAQPAQAQIRNNSIEFFGAWTEWSGEDAAPFHSGPATGVLAAFDVGWIFDPTLEFGFGRFATDEYFADGFGNPQPLGDVDEFELALGMRRWLRSAGLRPFIALRGGYTRLSAAADVPAPVGAGGDTLLVGLRLEQNGLFGGGSLGVEIPAGDRLRFTATGEASRYRYSDTKVFLEDAEVPSTGGSSWRYWIRLGLTFRWRS